MSAIKQNCRNCERSSEEQIEEKCGDVVDIKTAEIIHTIDGIEIIDMTDESFSSWKYDQIRGLYPMMAYLYFKEASI